MRAARVVLGALVLLLALLAVLVAVDVGRWRDQLTRGDARVAANASADVRFAPSTIVPFDPAGRLVGLVTPETIGEMLMLHQALPSGVRFGPWGPSTGRSADTPAR